MADKDNYNANAEPGKQDNMKILWKDRKHRLWFPLSFTKYYIQNGRIYIEKGLLNSTSDQTLLYRITDMQLRRSFIQKICGTGTIILISNVDAMPRIVLENIKNPKKVYNNLANLVEEARTRKNVVGKEFYARGGHDFDGPGGHGPVPPMPPMDSPDDDGPDYDDDYGPFGE